MTAVAAPVGVVGARCGCMVVRGRVGTFVAHGVANVARHRATGAVEAAVLDPLLELLDRGRRRVVLDGRGLRDRVGLDGSDTGLRLQRALNDRLLGRVVQPADVENRRGGLVAVRAGLAVAVLGVVCLRTQCVPTSSWRSAASAGASLTPSPTMATTSPSSCNRLTSRTLSSG
jgi:hypothetical protein